MKNLFKILVITSVILSFGSGISAQTDIEKSDLLKKCLSLQDLMPVLTHESDGTISQLYVLQHGVSFSPSTDILVSGRKVRFITKSQLSELSVTSYFLFWEFSISADSAKADFVYNYPGNNNSQSSIHIIATFRKNGNNWEVVNVNSERR